MIFHKSEAVSAQEACSDLELLHKQIIVRYPKTKFHIFFSQLTIARFSNEGNSSTYNSLEGFWITNKDSALLSSLTSFVTTEKKPSEVLKKAVFGPGSTCFELLKRSSIAPEKKRHVSPGVFQSRHFKSGDTVLCFSFILATKS